MLIAACLIQLAIPAPDSIKARRRVANAVKERLRQRFHLSVAEVGDSDERQEAVIGCVELGNDPRVMRERMERVIRFVESLGIAEVTGEDITIVRLDELQEVEEDEDDVPGRMERLVNHRRSRLAALLRERLAAILLERVSDPRLEGISIIEVRPAPDGSFARVFYRSRRDRTEVEAALASAKPFLRRCLSEGLEMRRVPELDFRYDPTEASGARMDEILEDLSKAGEDES